MTVAELMEKLQGLPQELPVVVNDGVTTHGVADEVEVRVADERDDACFGYEPLKPGDAYVKIS